MGIWQQVMLIADIYQASGYRYGKILYPEQYKNQDVNGVLAQLGQQGFEVAHMELDIPHYHGVIILKKQG